MQVFMIDGLNIPTFIFDNFTSECHLCPIISYKIMNDTDENLNNNLVIVMGNPNKI